MDAPLHMKAERGRLDIMRPFNLAQPTPYTSPLLTETIAPFVELATRWLNAGPPIKRLGLGCLAVRLFPEIEACRSALDAYLQPVDMQMTEPDSFEYRTNRRCSSQAVEGLTLNRIAKWSVDKVDVTGADSPVFMVRLETDLNSDADHVGALDHPVGVVQRVRRVRGTDRGGGGSTMSASTASTEELDCRASSAGMGVSSRDALMKVSQSAAGGIIFATSGHRRIGWDLRTRPEARSATATRHQ